MTQNSVKIEKPSKRKRARAMISHGDIEFLAYTLWERHGYKHGQDVMDWLEAEAILRNRQAPSGDTTSA